MHLLYQSSALRLRRGPLFGLPLTDQQFPPNFPVPVGKKSAHQPVQLWLPESLVSSAKAVSVQGLCVATKSGKPVCGTACLTWHGPVHNGEAVHG